MVKNILNPLLNFLKIGVTSLTFSLIFTPFSVSAQTNSVETECFTTTTGYQNCQVEFVPETEGFRIYWQNGQRDHISLLNNFAIWNHSEGVWDEASEFGICFDSKCLKINLERIEEIEQNLDLVNDLTCINPIQEEILCDVEYVAETGGMRIFWENGLIDHIRLTDFADEFWIWNHIENNWTLVSDIGVCVDDICIISIELLDAF